MGSILRTSTAEELYLEGDDDHLIVREGRRAEFKLPGEDPSLFPEVPDFAATSFHEVRAADLKRLIRRTMFATDVESTRYALGGVLVELTPEARRLIDELYGPIGRAGEASLARYSDEELAFLRDFLREGRALQVEHAARIRAGGAPPTATRSPSGRRAARGGELPRH
jgi:hypothetical protein